MARDFDYPMPQEGRMAKSYLWAVEKDARELRKKLRDGDNLPGWVQSKIVTAQDRIQTVNRYMGHKIAKLEGDVDALDNPSTNQALLGIAALGVVGYYLYRQSRAGQHTPAVLGPNDRQPPEFQPSNGQQMSKLRRQQAADQAQVVPFPGSSPAPQDFASMTWEEAKVYLPQWVVSARENVPPEAPPPEAVWESIKALAAQPEFRSSFANNKARYTAALENTDSVPEMLVHEGAGLAVLALALGEDPHSIPAPPGVAKSNPAGEGMVTLLTLAIGAGVMYYVLTRG